MTITAKYPGKCSTCSRKIKVGDAIEWSKGAGAQHAACAGKSAQAAPAAKPRKAAERAPRAPRAPRQSAPPPEGPMMRNDRAAYQVGEVLTCQLTPGEIAECEARQGLAATEITGEPCKRKGDRRVVVVVVHTDRMSQSDADDNGYCGRFGAVVRLATSDEAAPLVAERRAAAQAKADVETKEQAWAAQLAELTSGRIFVEGGAIERTGAEVLREERKGLHGTVSARWSRLADGSILVERYAYDDDRWGRWVTTAQLLDEARSSTRTLEDAIRGQRYSALDRAIVWLAAQAGKAPLPPVTVTLRGLSRPVMLRVRPSSYAPDRIVAGSMAESGQEHVDGRWITEWTWPLDRLRELIDSTAPAAAFADIEFAPGAQIGGDRLPLPDGLWIEGMREALAELERRHPL